MHRASSEPAAPTSTSVPSVEPRLVARFQAHLHAFLCGLRAGGLSIPVNKQLDFLDGIRALSPGTTGQLYWVGAATLVTSVDGQAIYEEVFRRYFGIGERAALITDDPSDDSSDEHGSDESEPTHTAGDGDDADATVDDADGGGVLAGRTSPEQPARFATTTARGRALMREIGEQLGQLVPRTRCRRRVQGRRPDRVDLRAVYLESRRTQGEVVRLRWRHRPSQQRRLLLLIDVSGSMQQYSADHLRFAHAAVACCADVAVFTFGTRLTDVTAHLRHPDVDAALDSLAGVVLDAGGGTLIGASLQEFLADGHCVTMARGAQIIVLSDGLERGDPTLMTASVRRLSLLSHRLAWWSPLACDPRYRPVTKAMAAVADDLDALIGVRNLTTALTGLPDTFAAVAGTDATRRIS